MRGERGKAKTIGVEDERGNSDTIGLGGLTYRGAIHSIVMLLYTHILQYRVLCNSIPLFFFGK